MLKINNSNYLFNLTPHEVKIYRVEDTETKESNGAKKRILKENVSPIAIIPSDGAVRLVLDKTIVNNINGIPLAKMVATGYQGLPDNLKEGDMVLVSGVTVSNNDFLNKMNDLGVKVTTVGETVWSDDLRTVIGCVELSLIN